jgi:hypothetical protein
MVDRSFAHLAPVGERRKMFLGLDLGQANDPAVLGGLLRIVTPGKFEMATFSCRESSRFDFCQMERFALGTTYPLIVLRIAEVLELLTVRNPACDIELLFDATGVGRAVGDLLRELRIWRMPRGGNRGSVTLVPVTLTSGADVNVKSAGLCVPKSDVIASAVVLFQSGQLRIADGIAGRDILIQELVNFRQFVSARGSRSFSNDGKVAKHDDTVTVLTLCAWGAQRDRRPGGYLPGQFPLPNSS